MQSNSKRFLISHEVQQVVAHPVVPSYIYHTHQDSGPVIGVEKD